ncbi:MAG: hypothetical protein KJ047_05260 [Anaerolineae bacterium]|nr:hypothetical protein [Anaerolineae bacterium]
MSKDILIHLRNSAKTHEFRDCERMMSKVINLLDPNQVITLALEQLKPYMVAFAIQHPEIKWLPAWTEHLERLEPIDYSTAAFGFYDGEKIFDRNGVISPGTVSFVEAVQLLDGSFKAYVENNPEVCRRLAWYSIDSVFVARVFAFWAELNPQAYKTYMGNPNLMNPGSRAEVSAIQKAAREYRDSLEVKTFRETLYLDLANQIDSMIKAGN